MEESKRGKKIEKGGRRKRAWWMCDENYFHHVRESGENSLSTTEVRHTKERMWREGVQGGCERERERELEEDLFSSPTSACVHDRRGREEDRGSKFSPP